MPSDQATDISAPGPVGSGVVPSNAPDTVSVAPESATGGHPAVDASASPIPAQDLEVQAADPRPAWLDAFSAKLKNALRAKLRDYRGESLVRYRWRHAQTGGEGHLEITVADVKVQVRKNAIPRIELRLDGPGGISVPESNASLRATVRGQREVVVFLYQGDEARKEIQATEGDIEPALRATARLARPTVPRADAFGSAYFGPRLAQGTALEVERESVDARIADFWPKYDGEAEDRWSMPLPAVEPFNEGEWVAAMMAYLAWGYLTIVQGAAVEVDAASKFTALRAVSLPPDDAYERTSDRPVELSPETVRALLEERQIELPWHVIEASCTSLNSGKHLVLTGPPGCGKTELATILAKEIAKGREGIVATGSPAWTTGDVIGRYFPRADGRSLVFRPGFFLRAIRENRCLVIDEFNRARIDDCLGELFTVLSEQDVELPYVVERDGKERVVRILAKPPDPVAASDDFEDFPVGPSFRLIGTMNDADRSDLSPLSFALLRRVDLIRLEAPDPMVVREIIDRALQKQIEKGRLEDYGYLFRWQGYSRRADQVLDTAIKSYAYELFADVAQGTDLVRQRAVGVASVIDVVRFATEGVRSSSMDKRGCATSDLAEAEAIVASYVAMAVVLKVLPQLDSLDWDRRERAIRHIVTCLGRQSAPFVRIEPFAGGQGANTTHYRARTQAYEPGRPVTLVSFVVDELRRHYVLEHRDEFFEALLPRG